ncbi:hypothetical protein [Dokdonella sp.]|uniref:hypothetical protein n=1 Tax=Dokdonella sp. TaxID=2291710 RepID=UPI003529BFFD
MSATDKNWTPACAGVTETYWWNKDGKSNVFSLVIPALRQAQGRLGYAEAGRAKSARPTPTAPLFTPAKAGLWRQDAGTNIRVANGPKGKLQEPHVVQFLLSSSQIAE